MKTRLTDLLDEHRLLAEALGAIRRDAHGRRLGAVRVRLAWLTGVLDRHIRLEEEHLMPVFETLEHPVPNGAPAVFLRDHALIRRLLGEAATALEADLPVALADALARLDGVLEHHDLREERYFKARLDGELSEGERARILALHPEPGPLPEGPGDRVPAPRPPEGDSTDRLRWAIATGDLDSAASIARSLAVPAPKGGRLRARLMERLEAGEPVSAWDAMVPLTLVIDHFPAGSRGFV